MELNSSTIMANYIISVYFRGDMEGILQAEVLNKTKTHCISSSYDICNHTLYLDKAFCDNKSETSWFFPVFYSVFYSKYNKLAQS